MEGLIGGYDRRVCGQGEVNTGESVETYHDKQDV